ncbi:unknown [Clostridium sp. CAG:590]|nr:unknown [Clostridium sp. CAG:590]
MEEVSQLIDNLIKITDYLYQENIQVAYRLLYLVLPSLDQFISQIEQDEKKDILKEKLLQALEAMEKEDYILLADILQYEVVEQLQNM